jgi:ABC-type multidrug transport system fused ATPase/permease subunit
MRAFGDRLWRLAWRLSPTTRGHRRWLLAGTLGSVLVVAARIAYAYPLRGLLDANFNKHHAHALNVAGGSTLLLGAIFLGIVATQGTGEFIQRVSFARFSIGVVRKVRANALAGISRGAAGTEQAAAGDVISRIVGDATRFKSGLKGYLMRTTQSGTFFVAVTVGLALVDVRMGLVFFAGCATLIVLAAWGASRVNAVSTRLRKKEAKLVARMHLALAGDAEQLLALEDARPAKRADGKVARMEALTILGTHLVLGLTVCGVLAIGLHDADTGRIQPGDLFVALYYLVTVHNQMLKLGRQTVRLGRLLTSAERLVRLADRPPSAVRVREPDGLFASWAHA